MEIENRKLLPAQICRRSWTCLRKEKKKQVEPTRGRSPRVILRANNGIVPPQEDHPRQGEGINEIAASQR